MTTIIMTIYRLCLSLWAGGAMFFSFVVAPSIFGFLRDQLPAAPPPGVHGLTSEIGQRLAGDTVGAIFPIYFALQVIVGALATGGAAYFTRKQLPSAVTSLCLTGAALGLVLIHLLFVFPYSSDLLTAHYQAADAGDSARAAADRRTFGMWHGISQTINLTTIALVLVALIKNNFDQRTKYCSDTSG